MEQYIHHLLHVSEDRYCGGSATDFREFLNDVTYVSRVCHSPFGGSTLKGSQNPKFWASKKPFDRRYLENDKLRHYMSISSTVLSNNVYHQHGQH